MFEGRKVSGRIVSIDCHYVCPIVRGKEIKSVKFGAKVNNVQTAYHSSDTSHSKYSMRAYA